MKKLIVIIIALLTLALAGCEKETSKTAEGWAIWYVLDGHDSTIIEPFIYTVEAAYCDFGEDTDFEYYACFVVTVQHDLDCDARERVFAVVVAWEKTFLMRVLQLTTIPESAITDIDEVEME